MSTSQAVLQYLPFLRRYARALTGSQTSGDAYVAATLEALIASPNMLERAAPRVALYRLFTKIWNSVAVNEKADVGGEPDLAAGAAPRRRSPRGRARPSCWSRSKASPRRTPPQILDVDVPTLRGLVEESGRELAAEIATDVLIIEDETFIAMDLESPGRKPRPPCHRRRAHPCRGGRARQGRSGRASSSPTSSSPTAAPASTR